MSRIWVILILTAAGGLYCTAKTVLAVTQTHWIEAAIGASAVVVLLISAVGMAFVLFGRKRLRASFDATGTTLRVGRAMFWWLGVWFGAVIIGLVLFELYGSHLGGWAADFRVRTVGWLGFALVAAVGGLGLIVRAARREQPRLFLSATGWICMMPRVSSISPGTTSPTSPVKSRPAEIFAPLCSNTAMGRRR